VGLFVPSESFRDRRAAWRRLVLAASLEAPSAAVWGVFPVRRQASFYSFGGVVSADLCARHPATFASFSCRAGAVFCARCVAALASAVALCVCPLRFCCADVGSFWPSHCVAVVLPTAAKSGCVLLASSVRPAVFLNLLLAPSFGSSHVPAAVVLGAAVFIVDWPGSPCASEAAAGGTEGASRALFIRLAASR
jgi:hypothetical protein